MADGFVNAIDPDGQPVKIPAKNADAAFADGFRAETGEETKAREDAAKYGDRPLAAGAAAFGRGATLGLSDVALSKSGLVAPETLKGLQEHNQVASTVGDIAGSIAPALIPGVGEFTAGGLATRLGARAAEGAAALGVGKIGAGIATGLAEGALFGAGSAITEDILDDGNLDLAAEKLVSHVGLGAILGGATSGAGAAIEKAIGKVTGRAAVEAAASEAPLARLAGETTEAGAAAAPRSKFLPDVESLPDDEQIAGAVKRHASTIKDVFEKVGLEFPTAEKMVLRDLDITGSQMGKLRAKGVETTAARSILDDARYEGAKTLDQKLSLIRTKQSEAGSAIGESVSTFDTLAKEGERFNPIDVASKIDDEVIAPLKKGTSLNEPIIKRLRDESRRLRKIAQANGNELSFKEAEEFKRSLDPFLRWDSAEPGALKDALRKVRGIVNDEIEAKVESIAITHNSLERYDAWKSSKRLYGEMAELEKHAATRAAARDGNRYFSLTDYLAGNAGATIGAGMAGIGALSDGEIGPGDVAFAAAGMLGNKWARERLAHVMALQLDRLGKNKALEVVARGFKGAYVKAEKAATETAATAAAAPLAGTAAASVPGVVGAIPTPAVAPAFFAKYGQLLGAAAAKSANTLFATHAALAETDPDYRTAAAEAGFGTDATPEDGEALRRAHGLSVVQDTVDAQGKTLDDAVQGFLTAGTPRQAERQSVTPKTYQKRLDELSTLMADPAAMVEKLRAGPLLSSSAPNVAAAVAATAARGAKFLHDRAPKNPNPPTLPGMERPWKPSEMDVSRWDRYVRAVENPGSVLQDMRRGTVTREAVEALREVYPRMADDIRNRFIKAMTEKKRTLSYTQRMAIATLLGEQLEPTMAPDVVAGMQQLHASVQGPQSQPPPPGHRMQLQSAATTTQRIEGK